MRTLKVLCCMFLGSCGGALASAQTPLGSVFTFQGELRQSGNPATGSAHLRFRLYDALTGGAQVGPQMDLTGVPMAEGRFTVPLDFGAFGSSARWVEIEARVPSGGGTYTLLTPRQLVTPAPVSLFALNAAAATNATQLNGQGPSFYQNAARQDAYAHANPLVVEPEKASEEKGKYLYPELFGQPPEAGIGYVSEKNAQVGAK